MINEFKIIEINNIDYKIINKDREMFTVSINLINRLMEMKLPLKNQNTSIRNILNFLLWLDNMLRHNKGTVIRIPVYILYEYFSKNEYKKYLKILDDLNVLYNIPYDTGEMYEIGIKSKQYRVHKQYLNDDICLVIFNDRKEIIYNIENIVSNKKMINTIKKFDIDLIDAIKEEIKFKQNNDSLRSRLNSIFYIHHKRYLKKGNKVDRIYHSLTNLSSISRNFIHVNGIKFHNLDVKNCQPLLLCYYLIKNDMMFDLNYKEMCENGLLYECFFEASNDKIIHKQRRDNVKVGLYKYIFFSFRKTKINLKFKELFPKTYESLEHISKYKETLASRLQNVESEIFNSIIPIKSKYYFSLFDAIYYSDIDDYEFIYKSIKDKFNVYCLSPIIS